MIYLLKLSLDRLKSLPGLMNFLLMKMTLKSMIQWTPMVICLKLKPLMHRCRINIFSAEVMVPLGDNLVTAKVLGREQDHDSNPVGIWHSNPLLDTRVYKLMAIWKS
jgi:hypothetical protein